jgi:hypothetical protein
MRTNLFVGLSVALLAWCGLVGCDGQRDLCRKFCASVSAPRCELGCDGDEVVGGIGEAAPTSLENSPCGLRPLCPLSGSDAAACLPQGSPTFETYEWTRHAGPKGVGLLGGRGTSERVALCLVRWPGGEQFMDGSSWVRVGETCGGGFLDLDPGCFESARKASFLGAGGAVCWEGEGPSVVSTTESCPAGAVAKRPCRATEDCAEGLVCAAGRCGAPDGG